MLLLTALLLGTQVDGETTVRYLLSCRRANGAFGPADRPYTDLAWTYPAVHALILLGETVSEPAKVLKNGQGAETRTPAWTFHQRLKLNALLGGPPNLRSGKLERKGRPGYAEPFAPGSYFDLESLWHMTDALLTGIGTVENAPEVEAWVASRQSPDGGFADAGEPHLLPTCHAVLALARLGRPIPKASACAEWIRSCQDASGGFRAHPTSTDPHDAPDVWFASQAVLALKALGASPRDPEACVRWLNGLQNADGGFGDRRGWASRIYSTFYAVRALAELTGNARTAIVRKEPPSTKLRIDETLSIFQAHHKSPPGGAEMADQARALGFHLLGVKTNAPGAPPGSIDAARARAAERGYPLELVACPEQYDYRLRWLDGQAADHVANFLVPPTLSKDLAAKLDQAGRRGLAWPEFREQVIAPLVALGTLFYPEHDFTMTNAYRVYDDGGFNAVHAAHMNGPDRIRLYPYRERWLGRLPFIADGDAHGDMEKWRDRMKDIRTLYIAPSHRLDDYLDACRSGRTVCVLRTGADLTYYGTPEAVEFLKQRLKAWAWWD